MSCVSPSAPSWVCARALRSVSTCLRPDARRPPAFAGTIWLQQGSAPLADDAEDILRGGAVLAARIMARLASTPSTHAVQVQELLGLAGDDVDIATIARELGITADGRAALVGFQGAAVVVAHRCHRVERQRLSS